MSERQKVSIDQQIEEAHQAIEYVEKLDGRWGRKAEISLRQTRLRAIERTLFWVKENEAAIRHWMSEQKPLEVK